MIVRTAHSDNDMSSPSNASAMIEVEIICMRRIRYAGTRLYGAATRSVTATGDDRLDHSIIIVTIIIIINICQSRREHVAIALLKAHRKVEDLSRSLKRSEPKARA